MPTFHRRPSAVGVLDRNLSSRTMSRHILGHIPVAVAGVEAAPGIVMAVGAASVRCPDYRAVDCRNCAGWVAVADFLY
jgi:hypothetical protein